MTSVRVPPILDHLVWTVPDLQAGAELFAQHTGITPVFGGVHVGRGTANYLVGLCLPAGINGTSRSDSSAQSQSPLMYLEILGRDLQQDTPLGSELPLDTHKATEPSLRTWAIRPSSFDATVSAARSAGVDVGQVQDMSRETAAGELLEWRLTSRAPLPVAGLQPFLIDWKDSMHPATTIIPQVELTDLWFETPDIAGLTRTFSALGIESVRMELAQTLAMHAVVTGPAGSWKL